jgi:hypothetical protein
MGLFSRYKGICCAADHCGHPNLFPGDRCEHRRGSKVRVCAGRNLRLSRGQFESVAGATCPVWAAAVLAASGSGRARLLGARDGVPGVGLLLSLEPSPRCSHVVIDTLSLGEPEPDAEERAQRRATPAHGLKRVRAQVTSPAYLDVEGGGRWPGADRRCVFSE